MKHTLWRPIEGFEGLYEVSDEGQIRSLERRVRSGQRGGFRTVGERILVANVANKNGHLRVGLRKDGRTIPMWVHRAVAKAFIPNPEGHPYALHGPGGPADNRVSNLRWGTHSDNVLDMFRQGERKARTHCKRQHELTPENVYTPPGKPQVRACRKCHQARKKQYRQAKAS